MLKTIAEVSPQLMAFVLALRISLSRPQQQHVMQVADALITAEGSKTLSALYRHIVDDPCPKAAADTFREAPWTADDLRIPLREHLVQQAFAIADAEGAPRRVFLSLDDSLTDKDKYSERLQMVDWFFDHAHSWPNHPVYTKANVYWTPLKIDRYSSSCGGTTSHDELSPFLVSSGETCILKDDMVL